jgi:hypothetical protein
VALATGSPGTNRPAMGPRLAPPEMFTGHDEQVRTVVWVAAPEARRCWPLRFAQVSSPEASRARRTAPTAKAS